MWFSLQSTKTILWYLEINMADQPLTQCSVTDLAVSAVETELWLVALQANYFTHISVEHRHTLQTQIRRRKKRRLISISNVWLQSVLLQLNKKWKTPSSDTKIGNWFVLFIWFDSLRPIQQFFSYVGTGRPGFNQDKARIYVSCSRTQHSGAGEARTLGPSVSRQVLYHWATVLPK